MQTSDILIEMVPGQSYGEVAYRTISNRVITGKLRIPAEQVRSAAGWSQRLAKDCHLPGDIRVVYERVLKDFPISSALLASAYAWLEKVGLRGLSEKADESPSVCKAALFHHDIYAFHDSLFCIVWLEKSMGLELAFPQLKQRVPLHLGTVVVFDAGQPHGVLFAGEETFDLPRYAELPPQAFLSIDFNALLPGVPDTMQCIVKPDTEGWPGPVVMLTDGGPHVDEITGAWTRRGSYRRAPTGMDA